MKKIFPLMSLLVLSACSPSFAYLRFLFRDASDLTNGTLPNARLDPSSVTLQGNNFNASGGLLKLSPDLGVNSSFAVNGYLTINGVPTSTQQAQVVITTNTNQSNTDFLLFNNNGFTSGSNQWLFKGIPNTAASNSMDLLIGVTNGAEPPAFNQSHLYLSANSGNVGIGVGVQNDASSRLDVKLGSVTIRSEGNANTGLSIRGNPGSVSDLLVISTGTSRMLVVTSSGVFLSAVALYLNSGQYNNPDYVFEPGYPLSALDELQSYVNENKHLPGMKSTEELAADGNVNVIEQNRLLLEKLEEAYLYIFDLDKRLKVLEGR